MDDEIAKLRADMFRALVPTDADLLGMFPEDASNSEIARGLLQMFGLDGPDSMVTVDYDRMDEMQDERGD